jgi:hypothetical protein
VAEPHIFCPYRFTSYSVLLRNFSLIVLQVVWLKTELCSALEARKAATCRAEELEVALMEMVKEDNRLLLSAQVLFPLMLFVPFTIHLV